MTSPSSRKSDPNYSYGIVEMPQPDDVLYRLSYDCHTGELRLGKHFVIKKFQWEEDGDTFFKKIFCSDDPMAPSIRKEPIREAEFPSKERGYALVNNIKIPLSLRNAIFRTSKNGKKVQVYTEITRERAKSFKVSETEVQKFVEETYRARMDKKLKSDKRK